MTKRHHHKGYRRRHNPFGLGAGTVKTAAWVSVGAIAARALPETFLAKYNRDISGYALNIGAAVGSSWLAGMASKGAAEPVLIGGIAATILRIVSDNLGQKYGFLRGDTGFNLGLYVPSAFAVPTSSDPYGRVLASPYPVAAAVPAAAMTGLGKAGGRYRSRYSA